MFWKQVMVLEFLKPEHSGLVSRKGEWDQVLAYHDESGLLEVLWLRKQWISLAWTQNLYVTMVLSTHYSSSHVCSRVNTFSICPQGSMYLDTGYSRRLSQCHRRQVVGMGTVSLKGTRSREERGDSQLWSGMFHE